MAAPSGPGQVLEPPHKDLGRNLLLLSVPMLVVGILLQVYPTVQGCTGLMVLGYCSQSGPVHPYAGVGAFLLALFLLFLLLGCILLFWKPSEPSPPPILQYVPYAPWQAPLPPPPPPPPGVVVNVQQAAPPPLRVMVKCRNCGNVFDMVLGRCDRCGAPAA
jgi:hypothetical protein